MKMDHNSEYQTELQQYRSHLSGRFSKETIHILQQLRSLPYKAILVYPQTKMKHISLQRYERLLRSFAQRGYLSILCKSSDEFTFHKLTENMYQLSHDKYLLPLLRSKAVIVLCSHPSQITWAQCIPNKILWADFTANKELEETNEIVNMAKQADIVTASSALMKEDIALYEPLIIPNKFNHMKSNMDSFEDKIATHPKGWMVYSNLRKDGNIHVMTQTFLDFEGKHFYNGGAERYLLDLAELFHCKGHELTIYQYGIYPWVRRFQQTDIVSLDTRDLPPIKHSLHATKEFQQRFYEQVEERTLLNIYSPFYEAWPISSLPNIGISHGVAWDNPYAEYENAAQFWVMNQQYIESAGNCEEFVSVDTNTPNWFQTVNYELGRRIQVIPNYVDLEKFYPRVRDTKTERIVILYPRQLYSARGLYLVLEVIDEILQRFPQVDFHFVGRGGDHDTQHLAEKMNRWKERIKWDSLSLDEMPSAYQNADISLIPTIHSEGTSLACLEAMASGNAVIATRIGGLTDLVINNYNGYLVEPHADALKEAISSLLQNSEQLKLFKQRGVEVAQAFSKKNWMEKWTKNIEKKINPQMVRSNLPGRLIEFHLDQLPVDDRLLGKKVISYLNQGDLVYIRVKNQPANPTFSFGRIQWLGWEEPIFSKPDEIIEYHYDHGEAIVHEQTN